MPTRSIIAALPIFFLVACSEQPQTAQDICMETHEMLVKAKGQGFTQAALLSCVKQGPVRAKQDQEAIRKILEK